jgi:hypothetical protein
LQNKIEKKMKSENFLHTKLGRELIEKVQKDQNYQPTIFEVNKI